MAESVCRSCEGAHRTTTNYGEARQIVVGDSGWVHYGCFSHWLINDGLDRHFPGLLERERKVLLARMGVPEPKLPKLADLKEVGPRLQWTSGMRASQVQLDAWARYYRARREASDLADADASIADQDERREQALERAAEAAREFLAVLGEGAQGRGP